MRRVSLALLAIGMLGALSGYARELSLAAFFGVGRLTDAFFVAYSIPLVLTDLFLGAVLTATVVPAFAGLAADGKPAGREAAGLFGAAALVVAALGCAVAAIVWGVMPALVDFLAPGLDDPTMAQAAHYGHWLVWLVPLNGMLLLLCFAQNAFRAFVLPATTWLVGNVMFFLVVALFHVPLGPQTLTVGALSGPLLMLAVNALRAGHLGLLRWLRPDLRAPQLRAAFAAARPILLTVGIGSGLGLLMLAHVLLRREASTLGEGTVSALAFAFRIYEVPISLVTATVGTIVLPWFASLHAQGQSRRLAETTLQLVAWGLVILLPIAVLTWTHAEFFVRLLFHWGHFRDKDVLATAQALRGFAPAIVAETLVMVSFRIFYALGQPRLAVALGAVSLASLWVFGEFASRAADLTLLASALSAAFAAGALFALAAIGRILGISWRAACREGVEALLAVVVATLLVAGAGWLLPEGGLLKGGIEIAVFGAGYLAVVAMRLPLRRRQALALLKRHPGQAHSAAAGEEAA